MGQFRLCPARRSGEGGNVVALLGLSQRHGSERCGVVGRIGMDGRGESQRAGVLRRVPAWHVTLGWIGHVRVWTVTAGWHGWTWLGESLWNGPDRAVSWDWGDVVCRMELEWCGPAGAEWDCTGWSHWVG